MVVVVVVVRCDTNVYSVAEKSEAEKRFTFDGRGSE